MRLTIMLDLDVDPIFHDPHEIADEVLNADFDNAVPNETLGEMRNGSTVVFVSAEWEGNTDD